MRRILCLILVLLLGGLIVVMCGPEKRVAAQSSLHWALQLDGVSEATFLEASGLISESEVVEHRVTGQDGQVYIEKVPGALKWPNIVLRRGVSVNLDLARWRALVEDGKYEEARKNGSLVLYSPDQSEIARFDFVGAWPSRCGIASGSGDALSVVEEIEIAHNGLKRVH